ncbi:MAG: NADH-quinone oxidoreductase subunit D [Candidatus Aminicenantes bacterium]|nr:NADH-quinone oxidoreductase subunit D [Candidatus Aminicenantes bacterium]
MPDTTADRPELRQAADSLAGRFPGAGLSCAVEKGELSVRLGKENLTAVLTFLKADLGFNALDDIIVLDNIRAPGEAGKRFTVLYQLYRFPGFLRLRLAVDVGENEALDSAVPVYRSADWAEREAFDMFGVRFEGHPGLCRIYMPDEFEGHPLRKDFPLEGRVESEAPRNYGPGSYSLQAQERLSPEREDRHPSMDTSPGNPARGIKEIDLNMGPQHPSTHGVLRLKLAVDNEVVLRVVPVLGYLHRGMEKLWENLTYTQVVPLTDRLDYIAALSNNLGFVLAVEKLAGIEVPRRARYIRVVLAELQRLASHLAWLGFMANDIGAMSILLYSFEAREDLLDIFEEYCGARLTIHGIRIGGVPQDLVGALIARIRKALDMIPKRLADIRTLLDENRIWKERTVGVGLIGAGDAIEYGLTGPSLRASGVPWDIRKDIPYTSYDEFDFDVPLGRNGDVYDRYLVRLEEICQSIRIVRQGLDGLPEGEFSAKVPRVLKVPPGEVFHTVEAPKGVLGFYVKSNGTDKPERVKMKSPSFINLQSFEHMCKGNLFSDVVGILGSLDIVLGEIDK